MERQAALASPNTQTPPPHLNFLVVEDGVRNLKGAIRVQPCPGPRPGPPQCHHSRDDLRNDASAIEFLIYRLAAPVGRARCCMSRCALDEPVPAVCIGP